MRLPEHVAEEWARQALSRASLRELREAIADAIEALKGIAEDAEAGTLTTAASEAGNILFAVANYLDSIPPEEIYGSEARLLANSVEEALEYIAALTYVDAESTVSEIVAEVSDYFGGIFPTGEVINAIVPEVQDANNIPARAEKLAEIVDGIHSVFTHQEYEEQGLTDDDVDELDKTINEVIDELAAIDDLYLETINTIVEKLIEILRQFEEYLIASRE